jgi:periplasmic copper chaperone A
MTRPAARLGLIALVTVMLSAVGLAAASAHVSVQPGTAEQGGFAALAFRVPTERDDASTTKVEVAFPADQPLAFVSVRPHPGWTYEVTRTKLAKPIEAEGATITEVVSAVTWQAMSAATAIKPGEYDEFSVSVGTLPKADQMVFKALQTYDDGDVVSWIEEAAAGAEEPEHPAPTLKLTPSGAEGAGGSSASTPAQPAANTSDDNDSLAIWLAVVALLVGAGAGALSLLALRRRAETAPARDGTSANRADASV